MKTALPIAVAYIVIAALALSPAPRGAGGSTVARSAHARHDALGRLPAYRASTAAGRSAWTMSCSTTGRIGATGASRTCGVELTSFPAPAASETMPP